MKIKTLLFAAAITALALAFAAATALILPAPASATDVFRPALPKFQSAPASEVKLFHGFYVGAHGSWVQVETGASDIEAYAIGGHMGYNWQFRGGIVVGLEADFGRVFFDAKDSQDAWSATVRPRVGYAIGPVMPYVTGGWSFIKVDNIPTSFDGPVYGAGVELAATKELLLRVEYLRFDLDPVVADVVRAGVSVRF